MLAEETSTEGPINIYCTESLALLAMDRSATVNHDHL